MPDLFATATITGPFGPHYINRRTPCSMAYNAAGDATITVMLPDSSIITIAAPASSYSTRTFPGILSLSVTGGPVTIEIYTPDMVVDPKYLASTTATIKGTVDTDIGQGTAPVSQVVLTEPLGTSYDARGRTWTLGSGDTPSRSWTLGSGDVPSRGWALGSGDTPGRSWTLGSGDVPSRGWVLGSTDKPDRGWALGSGDTPGRSWTLGSSDVPSRGWALGSEDTPGRSWTLGSGDVPNRGWTLGSTDTPGRSWTLSSGDTPSRSWTLGASDNPKPYGSGGAAFNQDTTGNVLNVLTLANSTTTYDARQIRALDSGDTPGRSWTLGSGDVPSRGWTLGSGDTPGRSWTLSSGDTPSRSWALGSGDTPSRSWTLGSSDVPSRGWTLGSGDTPSRSWTLSASDVPDVSLNQSDPYATVPYLVSGYAQAFFSNVAPWAHSGNYVQVTITITPGSFLILDEMVINTGNNAYLWNAEFLLNSDLRQPESSWGAFMASAVGLQNQTSILYRAFGYECTILNDSGSNQTGTLGGNYNLTITSFSYSPHRYVYNGGSSNISIYYQWAGISSTNNTAANVYLGIYYRYAGTVTFAYSTNPSSTPSTGGGGGGGYPCWSADTLIDTPQGPVPHHQLKVGDTVYGLGGMPETISKLITNDHTETVYEVEPGVWVTGDQIIRSPDGSTISPLQIERGGTELRHRTVDKTYDLRVPSGWVRIPSGRYLSDRTIPGP